MWRVEERPGRGRCVIAQRDIAAGELIMIEEPYAMAISKEYQEVACAYCCKLCVNTTVFAANAAVANRYCSQDCLTLDYTLHGPEIPTLLKLSEIATGTGVSD